VHPPGAQLDEEQDVDRLQPKRLHGEEVTRQDPLCLSARELRLYANQLGSALFSEIFRDPGRPANAARFVFLDPRATEFYVEWERIAHDVVALLRAEAGRDPYDRALSDLIGELSTRSEEFRVRWAAHDVRFHRTGVKRFHHPLVGDLTLSYEVLELPADSGLTIFAYTRNRTRRHTTRSTSSPAGPRRPTRCPRSRAARKSELARRSCTGARASKSPRGEIVEPASRHSTAMTSFLQRIPTISLTCSGGGEEVRGAEPHHE
jgi:MmyB-like transcription regulator ligand binding domain